MADGGDSLHTPRPRCASSLNRRSLCLHHTGILGYCASTDYIYDPCLYCYYSINTRAVCGPTAARVPTIIGQDLAASPLGSFLCSVLSAISLSFIFLFLFLLFTSPRLGSLLERLLRASVEVSERSWLPLLRISASYFKRKVLKKKKTQSDRVSRSEWV